MSGMPDDYIHEQPTDALNESSSSSASSSSTSDDEVVGGELTSDSKIFQRIKELGQRRGPLKPIRRSYRPSIASRGSSSVGTGITDDTNDGDEDEDDGRGERENSGFVNVKALQRMLGNRLKERPLGKLQGAEESSSGEFMTASDANNEDENESDGSGETEGSGSVNMSAFQRVLGNRLKERPLEQLERTEESSSGELETGSLTVSVSATDVPSVSTNEPGEGTEAQQDEALVEAVSGQIGSAGDYGGSGGSQDDEIISARSEAFGTQGSVVIAATQSNLETSKSKKESINTVQVAETQDIISAVPEKSLNGAPSCSEKGSSTSGNSEGRSVSDTSRTAMLPPSSIRETLSSVVKSKKYPHSPNKESVSSRTLPQTSNMSVETATSAKVASKSHSVGMMTSTPAPDSHLSRSLQLGVSAIIGDHLNLSSFPSYDISSKNESTSAPFSEPRSRISSDAKKRLTFESGEEGSTKEATESSLTRTLDLCDFVELEGNQTSSAPRVLPQEGVGNMSEVTHRMAKSNDSVSGDDLNVREQQEVRQPSQISGGEQDTSTNQNQDNLSRLSGNIAEDEEIIQDNVMSPDTASESNENDDDEILDQSVVSKVSDEQVSVSSSTAEEIFMSKCMAAKAYAEKNNIAVGNVTAKESTIGENIPPARMLKLKGPNIFPQVRLTASDRATAEEAKARMAAVERNRQSREQGEDSTESSAVSEGRYDPSRRFKRQRKSTGGSFLKKHPSEIYSSVLSFVAKTSMTSSQSSRIGLSSQSQSQRGSTQQNNVLPSIQEPDRGEQDIGSQSQPSQSPDAARVIPDLLPDLLPAGRTTSHVTSEAPPESVIRSASEFAPQLVGSEMSHLVKGSMELLFSHGEIAQTPRRIVYQNQNMEQCQEPILNVPSISNKRRSAEDSKGQEHSSIHSVATKDHVSGTPNSSASPAIETNRNSDVAERSDEPSSNDFHTADRAEQGIVSSSTPRRGSSVHYLLGKSPSLSRRTLYSAPTEDSSDDERSLVLEKDGQEDTRRKSVDKHRLKQILKERSQSRMPTVDSSSSEEEVEPRQKFRRSVDEHPRRQSDTAAMLSVRHSEASLPKASSLLKSGRSSYDNLALERRNAGTPSSSPEGDKFEKLPEELPSELNAASKTRAGTIQEISTGDDVLQPEPDSSNFVLPDTVGPIPVSPSSRASRLEASSRESEASERSDATVPISSFLEAQKRKKLSLTSSTADHQREVTSSTATQMYEEEMTEGHGMEIDNEVAEDRREVSRQLQLPATPLTTLPTTSDGTFVIPRKSRRSSRLPVAPPSAPMLSPRNEVGTPDDVTPMAEEDNMSIQGEIQDGSTTPQKSISIRQSKKSVTSMKDRVSAKQSTRRSSFISPIQQSRDKRESANQISPMKTHSRSRVGRFSHPSVSVRRDVFDEEIAEAPEVDQPDVEELPAETTSSPAAKRKVSRQGLSSSKSRRTEIEPGRSDVEQDYREQTLTRPGTSTSRRSLNSKSQSQILNREEEETESNEPVRQTGRTRVSTRLEDSVKSTGRLRNPTRSETPGHRQSRDSEGKRSLRRSPRLSSGASAVVPIPEDRTPPETESTRTEGRRKRRGEPLNAPERMAVVEVEESEEPIPSSSRQTTSSRVQPVKGIAAKAPQKTTATRPRAAPKKPKKNDLEGLMRNDNLISTQLVRWKCEANSIQMSNVEIQEMTDFLNEKLEEMLNELQRKTLREDGMFSFIELESAFKSLGLIQGVPNEFLCWCAQLLTPEDYKRAQGVLIPKGRDKDT